MCMKRVLYIGGFQLPDKNAAAFRVLSNAKALRVIGFKVVFLNALIESETSEPHKTEYEGFKCLEYKRESQKEYLLKCDRIISVIKKLQIDIIIAYNYPAVALERLRKYCQKNSIKCYADATEWYIPKGNIIFRIIKGLDSEFRMRYVHPKMDGIIAISDYLYQYYKGKVNTIKVPPLVDINEKKWNIDVKKNEKGIKLIYAGSPSAQKERLDIIVNEIESYKGGVDFRLDVIGITEKQFNEIYKCKYNGEKVTFWGNMSNLEVIKMIKRANWSIIIRDNNKVVQAGFPTKISESISCGTPVIANRFSDIYDYLGNDNSIMVENVTNLCDVLKTCNKTKIAIDNTLFDYRKYLDVFDLFMNKAYTRKEKK